MSENIVQLSTDNFKTEVLDSDKPVLVDFWAPWCGPCHMVAPVLEEVANDYKEKIRVAKLNVDENQKVAADYEILSIPTLIVFKSGQVQKKIVGALPKRKLVEELKQWID